jgi:hypothetical protein
MKNSPVDPQLGNMEHFFTDCMMAIDILSHEELRLVFFASLAGASKRALLGEPDIILQGIDADIKEQVDEIMNRVRVCFHRAKQQRIESN